MWPSQATRWPVSTTYCSPGLKVRRCIEPNEETSSRPAPEICRTKSPSPPKKDLAPPNFVSTTKDVSPARYELDWTINIWFCISIPTTSPGAPGANVTSPGPPRAVNVETNADSPPTARLRAPKTPPFISECRSTLADIETIAPASAAIVCSGCKFTIARAKAP
jgi:hypothetical protein